MDDMTRDLTTLKFEGPRFDDHGLDLDVLPELTAYKALLIETAKSLWRARHPDRERLPKGFEAGLSIKFYRLTEGSTGVPLKRVIPEDKGNLSLLEDELDQAADLLESTIECASAGRSLPAELPKNVIPLFGEFGRTLHPGEGIGIRSVRRNVEVHFTQEVGEQLARIAEGDYEDSVDIVGEVRATDLDGFSFALREDDGNKARGYFVPEQEVLFTEALRDHAVQRLRVVGVGEFSGTTGRLKVIRKVKDLRPVSIQGASFDASAPPIWEALSGIASQVPEEAWDKLPRDGAKNFRRYLYGSK
jgi:hypothetical protein